MKPITVIVTAATLTSWVSSDYPNFTRMTQAELASYKVTLATEDRVYCADVQRNAASRRTGC